MITCISCGKEVTNDYIKFKCPSCGKGVILRCETCRSRQVKYTCPECKFTSP